MNLPSAEGIFRQILYGNEYFRKDFGKASTEFMLPDCFGFPASLPSILAHAGMKGFSTQKLNAAWQPAPKIGGPDSPEHTPEGIPFNVGLWIGPDGKSVIAALNPGGYGSSVYTDLSQEPGPPPPRPQLTERGKSAAHAGAVAWPRKTARVGTGLGEANRSGRQSHRRLRRLPLRRHRRRRGRCPGIYRQTVGSHR